MAPTSIRLRRASAQAVMGLVLMLTAACAPAQAVPPDGVLNCDGEASPRPGIDENGCWPIPGYFAVPPEVTPPESEESATIVVEGSGSPPAWIEGGIFFVGAVAPSGDVVLETRFEWPDAEFAVPPGPYQVTMFARRCDANCDFLDPPTLSCVVDLLAEPSLTYALSYELRVPDNYDSYTDLGSTCELQDR